MSLFGFQGIQALNHAGVYYDEDPPVPIPNTEVKLISADNTWLETTRKDRSSPAICKNRGNNLCFLPFLCAFYDKPYRKTTGHSNIFF